MAGNEKQFIYDEFKIMFPSIARKVVDWYSNGKWEIVLILEDGCKKTYDFLLKTIRNSINYDECDNPSEDDFRKNFSLRLYRMMIDRNISQNELSKLSNISQHTISKYINAKATPSYYNLHKLSKALKCSLNDFGYYD